MKKVIEKKLRGDKRATIVYVVIFLWVVLSVLTGLYKTDFEKTGVYFLALTAFVGSYIWGESVRQSCSTSIFLGGKSSSREIMLYIVVALWLILGAYGIISKSDILSMAADFAALSPFVSAFLLGQTYKPVDSATLRPQLSPQSTYPAIQQPPPPPQSTILQGSTPTEEIIPDIQEEDTGI